MATMFTQRLHQLLDDAELPEAIAERASSFGKMFRIPSKRAELILLGTVPPNEELINAICEEFEVTPGWLRGKED